MTQEKKERIKAIRARLATLTEDDKQALISRGLITNIDGHVLSIPNTILLYIQANGTTPTVIGGYRQWKAAGRQVKRGEHGSMIWFPVGDKTEDGDVLDAVSFYTTTVFDISQTELIKAQ